MFNLLAKIGRRPWSAKCVSALTILAPGVYYGVQSLHLDLMERLFTAQAPTGEPEELSERLRRLIDDTYAEVKDRYRRSSIPAVAELEEQFFGKSDLSIKWFCSSTMDPITFGSSDLRPGVLIGLPSYYNYDNPKDLPDNLYKVNNLGLFKKYFKNKEDSVDPQTHPPQHPDISSCMNIDRHSPIGMDYTETLVLSEAARKFSIAKQLFLGDCYRPLAEYVGSCFSLAFAVALSRGMVKKLRLSNAHVSQRMILYMVSGVVGFMYHRFVLGSIEDYLDKKATDRAIIISEEYKLGFEEASEKAAKRHRLLSEIIAAQS